MAAAESLGSRIEGREMRSALLASRACLLSIAFGCVLFAPGFGTLMSGHIGAGVVIFSVAIFFIIGGFMGKIVSIFWNAKV
jgi:hypothetical protein